MNEELKSKDKQLHFSEKKMIDYEKMINQVQKEAQKEVSEKERFTILKAQDKEIH